MEAEGWNSEREATDWSDCDGRTRRADFASMRRLLREQEREG